MNVCLTPRERGLSFKEIQVSRTGTDARTVSMDFIVVPGFSMMALSSVLEPIQRANAEAGRKIISWRLRSWDGQAVACSSGMSVPVDGPVRSEEAPDFTFVCASRKPETNLPARLPDYIRGLWRRGRVVGGICGGTYALAKAGILAGRRFTLHWEHHPVFRARWPDLDPSNEVYCIDERIVTCAGGAAAADMALELINACCGEKAVFAAMEQCLIGTKRSETAEQTPCIAARLGTRNENLLRAIEWIEDNFQTESGIGNLYDAVGVSPRQIQRLFRDHVGLSPLKYMKERRLRHARALLAETDMSVVQIAALCCYETTTYFSADFRRRYGVSPHQFSMLERRT